MISIDSNGNNHDLDKIHFQILREWNFKKQNFHYKGVDFFEITQFFLWDKVSRALRRQRGEVDEYDEIELIPKAPLVEAVLNHFSRIPKIKSDRDKILFPLWNPRLKNVYNDLKSIPSLKLIKTNINWILYRKHSHNLLTRKDLQFSRHLHNQIILGLNRNDIQLTDKEDLQLKHQIKGSIGILHRVKSEINIIKPDLVFLHTDNHPPYQIYCLYARSKNIPVMMFQHGLDCEHYILDNSYASHIAVWGPRRLEDYITKSVNKADIVITGNPNFIEHTQRKETHKFRNTKNILWATRPHATEKCYSPHDRPSIGQDILKALIPFLKLNKDKNLIIRPHPATNIDLYLSVINQLSARLQEQIIIENKLPVIDQIESSDVVICEDTTLALETMILNKPIVHVHFGLNSPVLNLADVNAAFLARSGTELVGGLTDFYNNPDLFYANQSKGHKEFIKLNSVYPLNSLTKISNFVQEILSADN